MSNLVKRLDAHFVACAAAAGAAVVGAAQKSEAAVVWSGIVNIPIQQTTNGLYINIVTGQINEPGNTAGGSVPGWDLNPYSTGATWYGFGNANWGFVGAGTTLGQLTAGVTVDGTNATLTGSAATPAGWPTAAPGAYLGFRFFNEVAAQVQYGWARYIKHTGASPATGSSATSAR